MCDVSWSAQLSARPEMKKLNKAPHGFLLSSVPYKSPESDRNPVLSKIISACTSVHLRAPARTHVQRFTVPEKPVRRYSVRTALCSAMKMNAQSTNAMEGRAPRARSRFIAITCIRDFLFPRKRVVGSHFNDVVSAAIYWHTFASKSCQ
jgi:hypothetical protein